MPVISQFGTNVVNGRVVSLDGGGNPVNYDGRAQIIPNGSGLLVASIVDGKYFHMDDYSQDDLPATSGDYALGNGADAVITLGAPGTFRNHVLTGLAFGYRSAPTSGYLQIQDGANTVFRVPITSAGAGFVPFEPAKRGTENTAMIITLGGGGAGVIGEVSILGRRIE
jgi:hypothetical protein